MRTLHIYIFSLGRAIAHTTSYDENPPDVNKKNRPRLKSPDRFYEEGTVP